MNIDITDEKLIEMCNALLDISDDEIKQMMEAPSKEMLTKSIAKDGIGFIYKG